MKDKLRDKYVSHLTTIVFLMTWQRFTQDTKSVKDYIA